MACILSKEDLNRIAMGLMLYKQSLDIENVKENDLFEYNNIEVCETDNLAKRLDLIGDYYEMESE